MGRKERRSRQKQAKNNPLKKDAVANPKVLWVIAIVSICLVAATFYIRNA
ncbi:MAG: hypothetical protein OCD01_11305 [Fibrobacterales bacterium]|jgi:hypothetical protein